MSGDNNQNESVESVNRREYLGAVGSLGFAAADIPDFGRDRSTRIVTDVSRGEPVRTKSVPSEWYSHEQRVRRVKQNLSNSPGAFGIDNSDQVNIGISNSPETVSGFSKSQISLTSPNPNELADVPDFVEGIKIEKSDDETDGRPHCNDQTEYNPVRGGVQCEAQASSGQFGTTTCKVWDKYDNPCMMTAAHLYLENSCSSIVGQELEHDNDRMGEIPRSDNVNIYDDWVAVDKSGNSTNGYSIYTEGVGKVVGYKTYDGLNYMKSNREDVHQLGTNTCITTGNINQIDKSYTYVNGCYDTEWAVSCSMDTDDRDSGGPIYDKWTDIYGRTKMSIVAPTWGGGDGWCQGTAAYRINIKADINFTSP